jgi:hypothetical protein
MPKSKEQTEREMELGDKDEDIYTAEGREVAEDDDTITNSDEGFMEGYDSGEKTARCAKCNKILEDDFHEKEIEGEDYRFCSESCAETFKKPQNE